MEPVAFLALHPPFESLPPAALASIAEGLEIAYRPAGDRVLARGGERSRHLFVIRKGTVRLERDGQLLQVLEEGDCFGFPSLIGRTSPHADAVVADDALLYLLPESLFARLMEHRAFSEYFLTDLTARLRLSASAHTLPLGAELGASLRTLPLRSPVSISAAATVGEAARLMRDQRVSALVVEGAPPGILTDRDLRRRVLAEGRGPETVVAVVATRPLLTLEPGATLFDALLFMLENHVHHVPLAEGGQVVAVLTDTDLLRLHVKSPLYLLRNVERLDVRSDLARYATDLTGMVETLVWGGLDPLRVASVVSRLNDALARRLLASAEAELGPPPCAYAWIVFGSEGRLEQALLTDQDNALVYEGDGPEAASYFAALAGQVVGGLMTAGFPACRGGFMATQWHRPLGEWVRLFRSWVEKPEPEPLVQALNFFDFRPVHGTLSLEPLEAVLLAAGREKRFLAHLSKASTALSPPLTAFRHIRQEEGGVDLKKGGIVPIVSLARLHALEAGSPARSTVERLEAAARAGTLSRDAASTLDEAFRFLLGLRIREQLRGLRAGEPASNRARLEHLSNLERRHLKDVFVAVRELQQATLLRHDPQRLA